MPISSLLPKRSSLRGTLLLCLLAAAAGHAQTLARPGWAGSGVIVEPWWRRAIFYRIHPATFQATGDATTGDLPGITQRLDYLQSLGIDAILLEPPFAQSDLGDFVQQASRRHIRILIALDFSQPDTTLASTRQLLNTGVAGLYLHTSTLPTDNASSLLQDFRHMTDSVPGERVLLADSTPNQLLEKIVEQAAHLVAAPTFFGTTAATLRAQAMPLVGNPYSTSNPLLSLDPKPTTQPSALAALLLASRTAVILDAGQEIGQDPAAILQWTPTNITPKPEPPLTLSTPPDAPSPSTYGTFKPYVAPAPARPKPLKLADPDNPAPIDPNTLPGFTAAAVAELPSPPTAGTLNVATEDANPLSLLNLYRHLIQLHHGNPSIRNGSEHLFDHDTENALAWVRRAPAGSCTAATIVVVANLSDKPLTLSLTSDLATLRIRPATLRTLLTSAKTLPSETTDHLSLPPGAIYLAELYHSGPSEPEAPTRHRHHR